MLGPKVSLNRVTTVIALVVGVSVKVVVVGKLVMVVDGAVRLATIIDSPACPERGVLDITKRDSV